MVQTVRFLKFITLAFLFALPGASAGSPALAGARLTLHWIDNSTNEAGFRIERKTASSGNYAEIAVVAANTVSYVDEGLSSATSYCYRLRAYNSKGNSGYTNEQCAKTASTPPPRRPKNLLLTVKRAGKGSGSITATGINCGSDCREKYPSGSSIVLTANAAAGSTFAGWTGKACGSGTVILTRNVRCTAHFKVSSLTHRVAKAETASGTVRSTGNNCGDCGDSLGDRIGIYRPSTGEWFLDADGDYAWDRRVDVTVRTFSVPRSSPVVGDWSGMGRSQLGLFQAGTLQWHLDVNDNRAIDGCAVDVCVGPFGEAQDIAIAGRWRRGNHGIGVFRPSTGYWYLDSDAGGQLEACRTDGCAFLDNYMIGDAPVVGDWDGDGISRLGLFRGSTGEWFLDQNGNRSWDGCRHDRCIENFGRAGDVPVTGDWAGAGRSHIGVWRPSTGEWFLDHNGNGIWDGCSVDVCVARFGSAGDVPVVGKW
jgi:hypothetical protein